MRRQMSSTRKLPSQSGGRRRTPEARSKLEKIMRSKRSKSNAGSPGGAARVGASGMKPDYLQDIIVPPERIADMAKFKRFTKYYTPEDLVIKTAWHETGHAIGWVLKG